MAWMRPGRRPGRCERPARAAPSVKRRLVVANFSAGTFMAQTVEVKVPDIGDFTDVPVIEVLVKSGDTVKAEDSLVTLESDKATMDVPAPSAGTVKELKVKVGDKVSEGSVILTLESAAQGAAATPKSASPPSPQPS